MSESHFGHGGGAYCWVRGVYHGQGPTSSVFENDRAMSFLSVLSTIGKDTLAVVNAASPAANFFIPGAGTALQSLTGLVIAAEGHPAMQGAGMGAAKKDWVMSIAVGALPIFQAVLRSHGEILMIDSTALGEVIDSIVTLLNATAKLHASFSLTKVGAG
jgi:hypothetical protein